MFKPGSAEIVRTGDLAAAQTAAQQAQAASNAAAMARDAATAQRVLAEAAAGQAQASASAASASQAGAAAAVAAAFAGRTLTAGTGITGGGNLASDRTFSFDQSWGDARYAALGGNFSVSFGVGPATLGIHAVNRDTADARYIVKSGDTLTGTLNFNGHDGLWTTAGWLPGARLPPGYAVQWSAGAASWGAGVSADTFYVMRSPSNTNADPPTYVLALTPTTFAYSGSNATFGGHAVWHAGNFAPSDYARAYDLYRNRVVNGAMQVSQERGTAAVDVSTGSAYTVDQWRVVLSSAPGGALRAQQIASPTPGGSPFRVRHTVLVADASLASGDVYSIEQPIEGSMIADARFGSASARPLLLRFGVRTGIPGTYGVAIRNAAGTRSWVGTFMIAGGEASTEVIRTISVPGDTTGAWATDNGVGLTLTITLAAGASAHGSLGWQAGSFLTTSAQTNLMASLGATFDLFDVGLYVDRGAFGLQPQWQMPSPDVELVRCLRYYAVGANEQHTVPAAATSYASTYPVAFTTPMRAAPVVSPQYTAAVNVSSTSVVKTSTRHFTHFVVAAAAGNATSEFNWSADARF